MRKTRIGLKIIAALLAALTLTGCWDSFDIEKRDMVTAIILDKKEDHYYFYTEIADLSENSAQQGQSGDGQGQKGGGFSIVVAKGKTLSDARDDFNRKTVKELFLGAARILVFTDRMSENGIEEYLNRLRGQTDYRKAISLSTTSTDPMEILNNTPENVTSIGFAIESDLDTLVSDGTSFTMNIGDALRVLAVKGPGFLVPDIKIVEDKMTLNGYTVFNKEAKKIGFIPAESRKGIVYFLNPKSVFFYDVVYDGKRYVIRLRLNEKNIKPIYKDGKLTLNIDADFSAEIEFADKMEFMDDKTLTDIKKELEKQTRIDLTDAVNTSQKTFHCDYLNIYEYFRAAYNDEFYKLDWSDVYSKAQVNIKTKVNVNQSNIPEKER